MSTELERRREREKLAKEQAARENKAITYIDEDGCEVTVTPTGHIFFNMADWY